MFLSFGCFPIIDSLSNLISPLVGSNNPANKLSIVVFPQPLGPNKQISSPSFISRSILFKASYPLS